jgi:hypothetical protein
MVLTLMLALVAPLAAADVLLIEEVRQADRMDVPVNGQTMGEVETKFGAPPNKRGPIGDPPITQWEYDRWSVYFEFDRVLHTVLHPGQAVQNTTPGP